MTKKFTNREMKIARIGVEENPFVDTYHRWIKLGWAYFFGFVLLLFISINFVFSLIYINLPNGIANLQEGDFISGFAFSVQTFSTVGYGYMYPQNSIAHLVVTIELITSMLFTALLMGVVFAKFSRPSSRVIFSDKLLLTLINNTPSLVLRLGNIRVNSVYEGHATLSLLKTELTSEGEKLRKIYPLKLIRDTTPLFSLSWTLIHTIEESSPFKNLTIDDIHQSDWEIIATFAGLDQDIGQTIVGHTVYTSKMIQEAKKFEDMITLQNGSRIIDFSKLNQIQK